MPDEFTPKLSVLRSPQKNLWAELSKVPENFVLCGGTAVALRLGHRESIDFDFFGSHEFDPDEMYESLPFLQGSEVLQKSANTLTCVVDRQGPVQVSFFGVPKLKLIRSPSVAVKNGIKVASLIDLTGMKAAVVQKRAEAKDYLDVDILIRQQEVDLPIALSAAKLIYGDSFHPQNTLKALSYFGDGNLQTLPDEVKNRLAVAVKAVDLDNLPSLDSEGEEAKERGER